jgi:hypothetical protein
MFARRTIVLLLLAGAILLSLVFPISLIAQDRTRPGEKPGATVTKKLPNSSAPGKVAIFMGGTPKNQASTVNSLFKPSTPPNLPPTPKQMNAEEKIKLVQSDASVEASSVRNHIDTLRRQNLYSRLTPAQPKNEKGYLAFAGINTILCSNALDGTGTTPADGLAYYSRQTAANYPSIWIYHRVQQGRLYFFDINIETEPGDIPIKIAVDMIVYPLPIALNNGHLFVIVQASDIKIELAIIIDTKASYNKLYFYSSEVTELQ